MKKNIIYSLGLLLSLASCESSIEVKPKNFIAPDQVTTNISGLQNVLTSAYDRLQDFSYYGRDVALQGDAMADNIFTNPNIAAGGGRYSGANLNTAATPTATGSHYSFWTVAYNAILDCNTVIANIDAVAATDAVKNQVKGEAYGIRALAFFDLARAYGYEPKKVPTAGLGANFNKSVVLRLLPTTDPISGGPQVRSTIDQTYTQIESDFKKAIEFLPASTVAASRLRMNKAAAYGLLGKVYLYWEKYADAVTNFDLALSATNTGARLAPAGQYISVFRSSAGAPSSEALFEITFNNTTEIVGVVGANSTPYSYTNPNNRNNVSTFGGQTPSNELVALFENGDDRKAMIYSYAASLASQTGGGAQFNWVNKYSGSAGAPYADNMKVIRVADVLLMKAEALAEQNQFVAASDVVKNLRTNRNASILTVPLDASIKDYIQTERRRELFYEGHRWFDLKRKGNGIFKAAQTSRPSISPEDLRILAPIPAGEANNVPGLPQNPGY